MARQGTQNTWAYYTLDIPLVLDNIGQPGSRTGISSEAQRVADAMSDALLAFARPGDPRTGLTSEWSPYSLDRRAILVFDTLPRMGNDPRGGERRLYQRAPFIQRGTL